MRYASNRDVQRATQEVLKINSKYTGELPENGTERKKGLYSRKAPSVKGADIVY